MVVSTAGIAITALTLPRSRTRQSDKPRTSRLSRCATLGVRCRARLAEVGMSREVAAMRPSGHS